MSCKKFRAQHGATPSQAADRGQGASDRPLFAEHAHADSFRAWYCDDNEHQSLRTSVEHAGVGSVRACPWAGCQGHTQVSHAHK